MVQKIITILLIFTLNLAIGQTNDPVLFSVNNSPVHLSEFKYVYSKSSLDKSDFSRKSVEEYLDLFVKFKLKVQRAKELKMDTLENVKTELNGYVKQLAESYLIDKEVTDKLVVEAYERSKTEVFVNTILVMIEKGAKPTDTLKAYNAIQAAYKRLKNGESWSNVVKTASDDKNSKDKNGEIGFITAMLPDGFYGFESAAYNTPKGGFSDVFRSPLGYHILQVSDIRPARGEVEAAHILIRKTKDGKPIEGAKTRIEEVYSLLKAGNDFGELAKKYSEDDITKNRGGYIGFFGINQFERGFEDKAFALQNNGDYTEIFESSIGYHVIRRIGRKNLESFDVMKNKLKPKVARDGRHELAKSSIVGRIKKENNYKFNAEVLNAFVKTVDTSFNTYKWKPVENDFNKSVMTLAGNNYTLKEFVEYLNSNLRERVEAGANYGPQDAVKVLFDRYASEKCIEYEEGQLDKKYPEFLTLKREYEEGNLFFEVTKNNVWDKASQDSIGLQKFYNDYKVKYQWNERAQVSFYALEDSSKTMIEDLRKMATKKTSDKVLKKFNKKKAVVTIREELLEKGKNKVLDALPWKPGSLSKNEVNEFDKSLNFMKIEKLLPRSNKTLKEARGFVIADYQEYLEKKWVDELKRKYEVVINKSVLEPMIK
jgi:peptidyl-prolyl cis-trans isomerase SurA